MTVENLCELLEAYQSTFLESDGHEGNNLIQTVLKEVKRVPTAKGSVKFYKFYPKESYAYLQ